jgi:(1->4)-alpha-D-glucan 1-alpha-D-glucosylmutase
VADRLPPPTATYRIQLTPSFGFADTVGILDHLVGLGVSHLYLSPVAEAVPGSLHGYDVIDHTRVRADFGGDDGLTALLDAVAECGLGVIIDHVPNHMSVADAHLNDRWWEMLRDGRESPAAQWFDVDWDHTDGTVIVPKLGDPLDDVLAAGGLSIGDGDRGPELRYGPLRFPLAEGTGNSTSARPCTVSTTACSGGATRTATCAVSSRSTISSPCGPRSPTSPR